MWCIHFGLSNFAAKSKVYAEVVVKIKQIKRAGLGLAWAGRPFLNLSGGGF
jgi:hypothetical protein